MNSINSNGNFTYIVHQVEMKFLFIFNSIIQYCTLIVLMYDSKYGLCLMHKALKDEKRITEA